jgi:hypothetical protein
LGFGICPKPQSQIPIPNPQSPIPIHYKLNNKLIIYSESKLLRVLSSINYFDSQVA